MSQTQDAFTNSDDEEILFTKEMVQRLKKSAPQKAAFGPKSTSLLSDTNAVSTMNVLSAQKKCEYGADNKTSELESSSISTLMKETPSSEDLLLTPRYPL